MVAGAPVIFLLLCFSLLISLWSSLVSISGGGSSLLWSSDSDLASPEQIWVVFGVVGVARGRLPGRHALLQF